MALAVCSRDVKLYDWPDLFYFGRYEPPNKYISIRSICWSCDGKELVAVKTKGYPILLDVTSQSEEPIIPQDCPRFNNISVSTFSNCNPDLIAFGRYDGNVLVYNLRNLDTAVSINKMRNGVYYIDFSCNDSCIAIGTAAGEIILLDTTYEPCASFQSSDKPKNLSTIAFSKINSKHLAGGTKDGTLTLWNTDTLGVVYNFKQHTQRITGISFYDRTLFSVGADGKVICYDVRISQQFSICEFGMPLSSIDIRANAHELTMSTKTGTIRSYDIRNLSTPTMNIAISQNDPIRKIALQPDFFMKSDSGACNDSTASSSYTPEHQEPIIQQSNQTIPPATKLTQESKEKILQRLNTKLREVKEKFAYKVTEGLCIYIIDVAKEFTTTERKVDLMEKHIMQFLNVFEKTIEFRLLHNLEVLKIPASSKQTLSSRRPSSKQPSSSKPPSSFKRPQSSNCSSLKYNPEQPESSRHRTYSKHSNSRSSNCTESTIYCDDVSMLGKLLKYTGEETSEMGSNSSYVVSQGFQKNTK